MLNLPAEELDNIAAQIETAQHGKKGVEALEFQWLYKQETPIIELKRSKSIDLLREFGLLAPIVYVQQQRGLVSAHYMPHETQAHAHIHNHPRCGVAPSSLDMYLFAEYIIQLDVKTFMIAATPKGRVQGFGVFHYVGDPFAIRERIKPYGKLFDELGRLNKRRDYLSQQDLTARMQSSLNASGFFHKLIPLNGYRIAEGTMNFEENT